jgi:hypothetical protein
LRATLETTTGDTLEVTALVDTGADLNIFKEKFVTENKNKVHKNIYITNSTPLKTPHDDHAKLEIDGHTYCEGFIICDNL